MSKSRARYGWESDFPEFRSVQPSVVRERLESFVTDASPEQVRAWRDSIPPSRARWMKSSCATCSQSTTP